MFSAIAVLFYIGAWAILLHFVLRGEPLKPSRVLWITAVGLGFHGIAVYFSLVAETGYQFGFFKVPSLFMWVINSIVLLSSLKKPLHNLFLLLLPFSIIAILVGLVFDAPVAFTEQRSAGVIVHILLSILSYSLLTIASLQALLLAYQNKRLKEKHPKGFIGLLPPLQTMETLLFELVWAGELLLTLSILSGAIFIEDMFAQHLVHKTVFSIISWFIYAILLWGRHTIGWRGSAAIRWTLGGFVALMLAYFGSKLVLEVILKVA